ncbi:hypothetical protein Metho_0500 [Methanomethylovorans hollandica DSM 15978]|uniref:Uncharacterized protein n=1 Tax=Methanomethylovorans hollandica (strain DSM 15978 / NBRC 107637 / DMS1) TaxID=867904 RepID=L0KTK8_METHD|nr:hypothetical protein Metho_0500 [Methanomethylovorans hollandica DSM 15978]
MVYILVELSLKLMNYPSYSDIHLIYSGLIQTFATLKVHLKPHNYPVRKTYVKSQIITIYSH